uniref:Uncharacterized protein n=1 Tax=Timema cristinae TaxID=61476 RepID=A0A7R9GRC2_TIMCR|nr:unnamed protein product [Timema cristinae]
MGRVVVPSATEAIMDRGYDIMDMPSGGNERWWQNIPVRYIIIAQSSLSVFLMTFMGSTSPMAVTAMIKKVTVVGGDHSQMDVCPVDSTSNETYNVTTGEFEWNGATQTMALNGGSIGMIVTFLISARLCELFGVKKLVGYSLLISGILDCLQPTFIRLNVWIYITVLLIRGICLVGYVYLIMFVLNRCNENESDHHSGSSSGSMVGDYHKPPAVGSHFSEFGGILD